ncbi:hypothetical protein TNCV_86941 [Trichonephila clavipes]|nr:hypothetical protein TNCV_86941 [Trichonephila clavipes]
MENNICNSMILTSRRRHFYLVGQSKHKVGACGVNNQASAVLAGDELPFVAFSLMSKYFPEDEEYLTPDVLLDMLITTFIDPIVNMYTDENCIHIGTSPPDDVGSKNFPPWAVWK